MEEVDSRDLKGDTFLLGLFSMKKNYFLLHGNSGNWNYFTTFRNETETREKTDI